MASAYRRVSLAVALAIAVVATNSFADTLFYIEGFGSNLYKFDTATGVETLVGNTGLAGGNNSMAFSPTGTLYLHNTNGNLYTLNTTNASATLIGNTGIAGFPESLAFDLTGRLLAVDGVNLYEVNPANATSNLLGIITGPGGFPDDITVAPVPISVQGVGVVPAGTYFAVDTHSLFMIDPTTLVSTAIGQTAGDEALAFGPTGTLYTHNDLGALYTISLNPLSDSFLANTAPGLVFAVSVQRIPEPTTMIILALGAIGCGAGLGRSSRRR